MHISEIRNSARLTEIVSNELKQLGVTFHKEKRPATSSGEDYSRPGIFQKHLHLLELSQVRLANAFEVVVPKFVAEACDFMRPHIAAEGIFRKAGSTLRQKQIRFQLDAGLPLGQTHDANDVASVLKSFFRELPDPLLPTAMEESFLRSMLLTDGRAQLKAVLLTCLLLPPLAINTLAYFMQFLHTVARHHPSNRMSAKNLAIVFTPGLMPFAGDMNSERFRKHLLLVQLLIENAPDIGIVPLSVLKKLHEQQQQDEKVGVSATSVEEPQTKAKKKMKKKRSSSLSQMFNGFRRRIVGSPEHKAEKPQQQQTFQLDRPAAVIKPLAQEKASNSFGLKKKRELLGRLPNGGFLPNAPLIKESRKKVSPRGLDSAGIGSFPCDGPGYVQIPKQELEDLKDRLAAIESRVLQERDQLQQDSQTLKKRGREERPPFLGQALKMEGRTGHLLRSRSL